MTTVAAPIDYVHGYSEQESQRLRDQANTLAELLHHDSVFPPGHHVLEAGCGVGAQTVILAGKNPDTHFTSIDQSPASLELAKAAARRANLHNVRFEHADIFHLPFDEATFDHVFVCFVLEHLRNPREALVRLRSVLKPGGTLTVIEGDHGSAFYAPRSEAAQRTIQCLVELQARAGGNALIGRELYPLVRAAGFRDVSVSPRFVYADESRPAWVEGFTRKTFIAMVAGVREQALAASLIDAREWDLGMADLNATAGPGGTFCYTFFKAVARK